MTKEDIWVLFKKTGNINYYIKYKDMIEKGIDKLENRESKRDNTKWKKL
jgi:hypothetical protein